MQLMAKEEKRQALVCFCVDGQSEKDALQNQIEGLFDEVFGENVEVRFRYANFQGKNHGDITTLKGVTPDNVEKNIYKYYFKQQDKKSDLGWRDLTYIVHIIDLDGAYAQKEDIKLFTEEELLLANQLSIKGKEKNTLYFDDHIAVRNNEEAMAERNHRKRQIIEHLNSIDEITIGKKTVKYCLYYFSSNLDHFLHGEANLKGSDKVKKAIEFKEKISNPDELVKYFIKNEFCTVDDYNQSWKILRKGNASLLRGSNLNILLSKIAHSSIEDWM